MIGIYKIQSIKYPERYYIGCSTDIKIRILHHKINLNNRSHHSKKLQEHVDKYGIEDLTTLIVEKCDQNELFKLEKLYIEKEKPFFNIIKNTDDFRTTIIMEEEDWEKIKSIAFWDRKKLKNLTSTIMKDFIAQYEKKNGNIKPIPNE